LTSVLTTTAVNALPQIGRKPTRGRHALEVPAPFQTMLYQDKACNISNPSISPEKVVKSLVELVKIDRQWVSASRGVKWPPSDELPPRILAMVIDSCRI